jgi:hypothetical protein
MNLILQRISQSRQCTLGTLALPGSILNTLELPWVFEADCPGGAPSRSCVPAGLYDLVLHDTPRHPKSFALVNQDLGVIHEPDATFPNARVACLIHIASFTEDLLGCIGVGTVFGDYCSVSNSRIAYGEFTAAVPWVAGHTLSILNPQGVSSP